MAKTMWPYLSGQLRPAVSKACKESCIRRSEVRAAVDRHGERPGSVRVVLAIARTLAAIELPFDHSEASSR